MDKEEGIDVTIERTWQGGGVIMAMSYHVITVLSYHGDVAIVVMTRHGDIVISNDVMSRRRCHSRA